MCNKQNNDTFSETLEIIITCRKIHIGRMALLFSEKFVPKITKAVGIFLQNAER